MKYFSIHSIQAIKAKQFSIVVANIADTPERLKLANELYPDDKYLIERHFVKYDLSVIIK